jgi:peptide/nickel transport system substrate-binding protein
MRKAVLILVALTLMMLPACQPVSTRVSNPSATQGGTFIEGSSAGDAETLNYILAGDSASFGYVGLTLDSLYTYDNQWKMVPRLAARLPDVSPDGLTYRIAIRDDLHWTGGIPVTADDFVYTINDLFLSDWLNYAYKGDWEETVGGKTSYVKVSAVDKFTFQVKRQTVDPEFADNPLASLTPYPKHIAQKYAGDAKAFTQAPEFNNLNYTGNLGPYSYKDWVRNDKFVVARNTDYYLGKPIGAPYFDEYVTKLLGTPAAVHAALEANDITYAGIDPDQVAKFQKMPGIKVYTIPTRGYNLLVYNQRPNGWAGLRDRQVRQGISMAFDKKAILDNIMLGLGEQAYSFIPRISPWYTENGVMKFGTGDLYSRDKARQALATAGYPSKNGAIVDQSGKQVKLIVATNTGVKDRESTAYLAKQELAALGFEVEIKLVPWPTLLRKYMQNKVPGSSQELGFNNGAEAVSEEKWDIMVMGLSTHPIAPSGSNVFFSTRGGLNYFGYSNPEIDDLFLKLKTRDALDNEARKSLYARISQLIAEDQPADFLYFPAATPAFLSKVKGIEPGMRLGYSFYKWYFEPR